MTLQWAQIGFTDALTFTTSLLIKASKLASTSYIELEVLNKKLAYTGTYSLAAGYVLVKHSEGLMGPAQGRQILHISTTITTPPGP